MISRIRTTVAIAAICIVPAVAAQAQETTATATESAGTESATLDAGTVLATVNGVDITLGHVVALRGQLPDRYQALPDEVLYNGILEQLIQQTVLQQSLQGKLDLRMQLAMENEQRAFVANEAMTRLSEQPVDEADVQKLYDERYANAAPETEYNASHILVETEDEAKDLVAQLAGGADFAELAKQKSKGPSGPNGGQLGWFSKGMMVKPFEDAVVALEKGQVSAPVHTQFGWHVIKLNDTREKAKPTLDDVRADLTAEIQRSRVEAAIQALTDAADIQRSEIKVDPAVIRDPSIFGDE